MTSGTPAARAALILAVMLAVCCSAARAGLSLDALMQEFSRTNSAEARFTERKTLAVLDTPVIMQGILSYRRPDYIKKEVLEPAHSVFEIDGDRLSVESAQGYHTFSLDSHPLLRAFAAPYRAILAGDLNGLRQYYNIGLGGANDAWVMELTPKDSRVQERLTRITVTGNGSRITSIRIDESSGDSSLMTIIADEN